MSFVVYVGGSGNLGDVIEIRNWKNESFVSRWLTCVLICSKSLSYMPAEKHSTSYVEWRK